jgi:hypothetical protein
MSMSALSNFQSIELPPSHDGDRLSPQVTTGSQFQPGGQRDGGGPGVL